MKKLRIVLVGIAAIVVLLATSASTGASAGTTDRVSVDSAGNQGNDYCEWPAMSAEGRFVAFASDATNLIPSDTNAARDVFVRDRWSGTTQRVSVSTAGIEGNGDSLAPAISATGRYVVFDSEATNLVAGDTNDASDVFMHDRQTGQTTRVSVDSAGTQANDRSFAPATISADGRYVTFNSWASNLVLDDTNGVSDVFVSDRQTGQTTRVSVDSTGNEGNDVSWRPAMSADGRYIAFQSAATNLVGGDTNAAWDVFVHDRQTGQTVRMSLDSSANQGNNDSHWPFISADGRFVAFASDASNLVASDTNGYTDVFIRDRQTDQTTRVSVDSAGSEANAQSSSHFPTTSADGRVVAFASDASNLVADDTNLVQDAFVHDRVTGQTTRVSIDAAGNQGNGASGDPTTSGYGLSVAFGSYASNLVDGDSNGARDIFVHDRGGPVGGIAELPDVSGSSGRNYTALAALAAAVLLPLTAAAWYARRRLS